MDARSYGLGSWQQQPGQKGFDVSVTEEVSDTEFRSIVDACDRYAALAERTTYALVRRNRDRLLQISRLGGRIRMSADASPRFCKAGVEGSSPFVSTQLSCTTFWQWPQGNHALE